MTIYDRISSFYEWLTISERPYRRQALDLLDIQPHETLLEIGCGTGQTLRELAPGMGDNGRLIGIDLSPGMIKQAQSTLHCSSLI